MTRIEDFSILPGAIDGLVQLARCGHRLVVVSNQRGITRGLVSEQVLRGTEEALQEALRPHGAEIAGFYYCPHEKDAGCDCRKPRPGLLLRAADELGLDLVASWMVGDKATDVEAGIAAGCRTAYLGEERGVSATLTATSLAEAVDLICGSAPP